MVGRFVWRRHLEWKVKVKTQMQNRELKRRNDNHPARRSLWQSVNAALARMCPTREPKAAPCFTVPIAGHVVGQVCVCAIFDLPFLDRFERQASGLYVPVESWRIDGDENGEGSRTGAEIDRALNLNELRGAYMPCPWCGENGNMRYFCGCGGVVCGGKVKGKMFHCRASCGSAWRVGHSVHELKVTEERERREWQTPSPRGSTSQAPAKQLDSARLLLSPSRRK
jgi:hypothetical protein